VLANRLVLEENGLQFRNMFSGFTQKVRYSYLIERKVLKQKEKNFCFLQANWRKNKNSKTKAMSRFCFSFSCGFFPFEMTQNDEVKKVILFTFSLFTKSIFFEKWAHPQWLFLSVTQSEVYLPKKLNLHNDKASPVSLKCKTLNTMNEIQLGC